MLIAERRDPAARFAGTTRAAPWDELQAAYFAGEANWNYVVAPFIFDGIMVPTRRRVYVRQPDGTPVPGPVSVAIDITNVAFS
jgi:hypothetical protein